MVSRGEVEFAGMEQGRGFLVFARQQKKKATFVHGGGEFTQSNGIKKRGTNMGVEFWCGGEVGHSTILCLSGGWKRVDLTMGPKKKGKRMSVWRTFSLDRRPGETGEGQI